jgi:hypothetical protein
MRILRILGVERRRKSSICVSIIINVFRARKAIGMMRKRSDLVRMGISFLVYNLAGHFGVEVGLSIIIGVHRD